MTREELLKELEKIPKVETNNPISTINAINVDDLMNAVDRFNKIPNYNDLLKENQELEKQLEVGKEQYDDLVEEKESLQEQLSSKTLELEKLKKQLEELNRFKFSCKKDETQIPATIYNKKTVEDISKIKSQQKEFIKYLENMLDNENDIFSVARVKDVLQKYKEIIGVEDESR